MTDKDIKSSLNKTVVYNSKEGYKIKCLLTGGTIRKNKEGFYYQLELQPISGNCLIYAKLEDVELIQ